MKNRTIIDSLAVAWIRQVLSVVLITGCAGTSALSPSAGVGPSPELPKPQHQFIPTIKIAPAVGWHGDETPTPAPGLMVAAFATQLDHPRWMYRLPNGDVLIAETNAPNRPDDGPGIKGAAMRYFMKRAGAAVASANRITLLRDADHDGFVELRTAFLEGLNSPFGMALIGDTLYVANTDAIWAFRYAPGMVSIADRGAKVFDLPAGSINHHWTKNLLATSDGSRLYVTVGSNSNVAENGIDKEDGRAAILEFDLATKRSRVFATGLRNPNGLAWQPQTGALWTVVNERDEIGNDLVPDYLTSVDDGAFYGWPYSYFGQHVDARVQPQRPDLVAIAKVPDYALGAHTASLGLTFYTVGLFPAHYANGAFVGQHGSWNRNPPSGYQVIFIPFANGVPVGEPETILSGFVNERGEARGRPVGVTTDASGALLVADDVGNCVWRIAPVSDR